MFKKNMPKEEGKIIDIESGMKGNLKFNSSVNLKINSKFEGTLETKGILIIGEKADVKTKMIKGEDITIFGKVEGDVESSGRLMLGPPAKVIGNIKAPILVINEGAILRGNCQMPIERAIECEKSEFKESTKKKKKQKEKATATMICDMK